MMKFSKVLLLLLVNVGIREVFGQVKPPPEQLHPSLVERCAGLTTNADTFIADFFQCRGYHICRNRLYLGSGQCAEGLYFNNGMCDFPHNTRCLLCDPMKLDTDVHMLPIAGSCNEYSLCVNRIAARRTCANDFVFHDQDHACVLNDPAALVCAACPNIYSPNFVINIPAFGACNKFLRCTMQGSTPVECSPGQLFDIETNRCVPAAEATCQVSLQSIVFNYSFNECHSFDYSSHLSQIAVRMKFIMCPLQIHAWNISFASMDSGVLILFSVIVISYLILIHSHVDQKLLVKQNVSTVEPCSYSYNLRNKFYIVYINFDIYFIVQ